MGRPSKPDSEKSKNAGFAAYPSEIAALKKVAKATNHRAAFDYVRSLVILADHPLARKKIAAPRMLKNRRVTADQSL